MHFVLKRENLTENEAGLATLFDMKSAEGQIVQKNHHPISFEESWKALFFYFLLEFAEPSNHVDYFMFESLIILKY